MNKLFNIKYRLDRYLSIRPAAWELWYFYEKPDKVLVDSILQQEIEFDQALNTPYEYLIEQTNEQIVQITIQMD